MWKPTAPSERERYFASVLGKFSVHPLRLVKVYHGPMTITYSLQLIHPTRRSLNHLLSSGPVLEKISGIHPIRISDGGNFVNVEIPVLEPSTPTAKYLAQFNKGPFVTVGVDQWGKPARVNLHAHPTILFVGPTRSGKTEAMRSVLYGLLDKAAVLVLSQKRASWAGYPNLLSDPDHIYSALKLIVEEMAKYAEKGERLPALVIAIDDLSNLLSADNRIGSLLSRLASTGGEVAIYLLIATQSAGMKSGTGGFSLEDNITARVIYKTSSAWSASRATGSNSLAVNSLSGIPGDALLLVDGKAVRIATGHLDNTSLPTLQPKPLWLSLPTSTSLPRIKPARKPDEEEGKLIRQAKEQGSSMNQLINAVYGYKNDVTSNYIRSTLEEK